MQQADERKSSGSGNYDDVYGRWLQACMGKGPSSVPTGIPAPVSSYVSSVPAAVLETPTRVPVSSHDRAWALLQSPAENIERKEQTVRLESAATATETNLNNTLEAAKVARQEAEALLSRVSTSRQRDTTAPVTLSLLERMKLSHEVTPPVVTSTPAINSFNTSPDDISNSISATYEAALARLRQDQQSTHPPSYSKALDGLVAATSPQQQAPTQPLPSAVGETSQQTPMAPSDCRLPNPSALPSPVHAEVTSIASAIQQIEGGGTVLPNEATHPITQPLDPTGQTIQSPIAATGTVREIISPTPFLGSPPKDTQPSAEYLNSLVQLRTSSPPLPKVPSFSQPGTGSVYGQMLAEARSPGSSNFQLSPEGDATRGGGGGGSRPVQSSDADRLPVSLPSSLPPSLPQQTVAATPSQDTALPSSLISPDPVTMRHAADLLDVKPKTVPIAESSEIVTAALREHQPNAALWTVGSDEPHEEIPKIPSDTAIRSPTFENTQAILSQPYDAAVGRLRAQEQLASIPPPQPVPQSTVAYLNLTSVGGSELVSPPHPRLAAGRESEHISPVKPPSPSPAGGVGVVKDVKDSLAPMPRDLPPPVKAAVGITADSERVAANQNTVSPPRERVADGEVVPFVSEYQVRAGNQIPDVLPTTAHPPPPVTTTEYDIQPSLHSTNRMGYDIPPNFIPVRVPSDGSPAPLSTPSQLSPLSDFKSPMRVSMSPIMNPVRVGSTVTTSRGDSLINSLINNENGVGHINLNGVGVGSVVSDRMNAVEMDRSPSPLPTPRSVGSTPSPVPNPRVSIPQPSAAPPPPSGRRTTSTRGRVTNGVVGGTPSARVMKKTPTTTITPVTTTTTTASLNFDPNRMRKPHVPRLSKKALQSEGAERRPRSSFKAQPWTPPAATKTRSFRVEETTRPVRTTTPVARKSRVGNQLIETVYSTSNLKSSFARQ